jgi:hypothetical protein
MDNGKVGKSLSGLHLKRTPITKAKGRGSGRIPYTRRKSLCCYFGYIDKKQAGIWQYFWFSYYRQLKCSAIVLV